MLPWLMHPITRCSRKIFLKLNVFKRDKDCVPYGLESTRFFAAYKPVTVDVFQ